MEPDLIAGRIAHVDADTFAEPQCEARQNDREQVDQVLFLHLSFSQGTRNHPALTGLELHYI